MSVQPYSVADLTDAVRAGRTPRFLFFWGHRARPDGTVGPACLSQWWPAPFVVDGTAFATAEHYMMWAKAMLFGDRATAGKVLTVAHPNEAKTLGRAVAGFDERTWQEHRYDIVVAGNVAKFGQHPDLRAFLLATGERVLVEASPLDRVWGIGLASTDPAAADPARWRGLNLLGFALMRARAALRAGAPDADTASGSTADTRAVRPEPLSAPVRVARPD
ncbi:NADAR family protein [Micromonospora sp. NPDC023956]|uniref:NADAR family protein n=1 Tax=Micromonospora sp. NPDC023956 TaxID=3155722 RepID=UPI0033EC1BB3